jgi:hypothetical protein
MTRTIDVVRNVRASAAEVDAMLREHPTAVVNEDARTTLHVEGRNGSVSHDVVVHFEPCESGDWLVRLEPSGTARLLPTFEGTLAVTEDAGAATLRLVGAYEPPLGRIGAFGDGVIGHRIARQSLETFLDHVARRIDREVDARVPAGGRPAPAPPDPPDLRDRDAPESWLG